MTIRLVAVILLPVLPVVVNAELSPITDHAMSEVTGQAFVSVDRQYHPDANDSTAYTRVNLGMDIEVQTNVDAIEMGRYERAGEKPGTSDVYIEDFALGYINNQAYYSANPSMPRQGKPDGGAYAQGEIVPFSISNPFFEFAQDEITNEIVGFRLGFGDAMGVLSGSIKNLTGNVNIEILDRGEGLKNAESDGSFGDSLIVALAPYLTSGDPLYAKAQLVHGEGPNIGEADPIRAEYAGILNGEKIVIKDVAGITRGLLRIVGGTASSTINLVNPNCGFFCGKGDVEVMVKDCKALGIGVCFRLDSYNSFPIGEVSQVGGEPHLTGPVDGVFMSFQTKDLEWLKDVKRQNLSPADFIRATQGAFFNIPNGATVVNLEQALHGIPRLRTEYIDRGLGLF
ncbi:hypothetical protein [Marinobacter sediminicola]|uniref:hypothetical protein n=1 Tax=Marinobacter sediminicola TaxID=3072994 RepID=UPI0028123180|nr:hypothetical protein [Marinobacter sp. F26243]